MTLQQLPANLRVQLTGWTVHLAAVFLLTVFALTAILILSTEGRTVPDIFTVISSGGAAYLIGTVSKEKLGPKDPPEQ